MNHLHRHGSIDYYSYISKINNWNSMYKVILAAGAIIIVITFNNIGISIATLLFMIFLSVVAGGINAGDFFHLMLVPAAFIILGCVAIMLQFGQGQNCLFCIPISFTHIYITESSLILSMKVCLKAFASVSCMYMMILSTPMSEMIAVFRKMKIPGVVIDLMHLIYRYIFIMEDINKKQRDAAISRLGYDGIRTSLHTFGSQIANLLILSLKKSESYYDAMEARGYEGDCLFWEEERKFTIKQFLYGFVYVDLILAVFIAGYLS